MMHTTGNLHFLPVISTCKTCKRRAERMLDTVEVIIFLYGGRLTWKRSMVRIHSGHNSGTGATTGVKSQV
jgi:hypothetical protein